MPQPVVQQVFWKLQSLGCKPRKSGAGFYAYCPVHEADGERHKPSLSFAEGSTQPLVMTCHAGCELSDILRALGMELRDILAAVEQVQTEAGTPSKQAITEKQVTSWMERLFSNKQRFSWLEQNRHLKLGEILAAELGWDGDDYRIPVRNIHGTLLYAKTYNPDKSPRYKLPEGASAELFGAQRLKKLKDKDLVLLTEGEFDALVCRSLGYEAVSSTSGANTWKEDWGKVLSRFHVVAIGDNDNPGRKYVKRAMESIHRYGGHVNDLRWPEGTEAKADPTFLVAEQGAEAFHDLVVEAQRRDRLNVIDIGTLFSKEMESVPWAVEGWLAKDDVLIIGGEPGMGKSMVLLDLAIALASGQKFLRCIDVSGSYRVMIVDEENNQRLCRRRLQQFLAGAGLKNGNLAELPLMYFADNFLNLDDDKVSRRFRREVEAFRPDWILLDSLIRFHRRNENDNTEMAAFYAERLKPIAREYQCGLGILHHLSKPNKEASQQMAHRLRGASDLHGLVDGLWGLEGETSTNERRLHHKKCRWDLMQPTLQLCYKTNVEKTSAWLQAKEESRDAEEMIITRLAYNAGRGGERQELIEMLENAGFRSAERTFQRIATQLMKQGRVKKHKKGKAVTYWLSEYWQEPNYD